MLLESCWTALVHFFSFQSLFSSQQYPLAPDGSLEKPFFPDGEHGNTLPLDNGLEYLHPPEGELDDDLLDIPDEVVRPHPEGPPLKFPPFDTPSNNFSCVYPGLGRHFDPPSANDRTVWLKNKRPGGKDISIHTNYEDYAPRGIDRHVSDERCLVLRILTDNAIGTRLSEE